MTFKIFSFFKERSTSFICSPIAGNINASSKNEHLEKEEGFCSSKPHFPLFLHIDFKTTFMTLNVWFLPFFFLVKTRYCVKTV